MMCIVKRIALLGLSLSIFHAETAFSADTAEKAAFALESYHQRLSSVDVVYKLQTELNKKNILASAQFDLRMAKESNAPQDVISSLEQRAQQLGEGFSSKKNEEVEEPRLYHYVGVNGESSYALLDNKTLLPIYMQVYDGNIIKGYNSTDQSGVIEERYFTSDYLTWEKCGLTCDGLPLYKILNKYKSKIKVIEDDASTVHLSIPPDQEQQGYDFWLNKEQDYLPVHIRHFHSKKEVREIKYEEHGGLLLPTYAESVVYGYVANANYTGLEQNVHSLSKCQVVKILANDPSIKVPSIDFPPGTKVWDEILRTHYVVGGIDPLMSNILDNADVLIEKHVTIQPENSTPDLKNTPTSVSTEKENMVVPHEEVRSTKSRALIVIGLVFGIFIIGFLALRVYSRRHQ